MEVPKIMEMKKTEIVEVKQIKKPDPVVVSKPVVIKEDPEKKKLKEQAASKVAQGHLKSQAEVKKETIAPTFKIEKSGNQAGTKLPGPA